MNLYTEHAEEFASTRQGKWLGWDHLLQYFHKIKPLTILDLGCGNGRFLKFLVENRIPVEKYIGIDTSKPLLSMADQFMTSVMENNKISLFELKDLDLNKDWSSELKGDFNLIVGFGVTHHLDSFKARRQVFESAQKFLTGDGYLILTFWQFENVIKYQSKLTKVPDAKKDSKDYPDHDYIMTFGSNDAKRFCHSYTSEELVEMEKNTGLIREEIFFQDGSDHRQNLYIIYSKNNGQ